MTTSSVLAGWGMAALMLVPCLGGGRCLLPGALLVGSHVAAMQHIPPHHVNWAACLPARWLQVLLAGCPGRRLPHGPVVRQPRQTGVHCLPLLLLPASTAAYRLLVYTEEGVRGTDPRHAKGPEREKESRGHASSSPNVVFWAFLGSCDASEG